jgi:hypothetical protein
MSLLGSRWVGVAARSGLAAALGLVDPDHNARDAALLEYASSVLGYGAGTTVIDVGVYTLPESPRVPPASTALLLHLDSECAALQLESQQAAAFTLAWDVLREVTAGAHVCECAGMQRPPPTHTHYTDSTTMQSQPPPLAAHTAGSDAGDAASRAADKLRTALLAATLEPPPGAAAGATEVTAGSGGPSCDLGTTAPQQLPGQQEPSETAAAPPQEQEALLPPQSQQQQQSQLVLSPYAAQRLAALLARGPLTHCRLWRRLLLREQVHVAHTAELVLERAVQPPPLANALSEADYCARAAAQAAQAEAEAAAAEAAAVAAAAEQAAAAAVAAREAEDAARALELARVRCWWATLRCLPSALQPRSYGFATPVMHTYGHMQSVCVCAMHTAPQPCRCCCWVSLLATPPQKPKTLDEAVDLLVAQRLEEVRQGLAAEYAARGAALATRVAQLEAAHAFHAAGAPHHHTSSTAGSSSSSGGAAVAQPGARAPQTCSPQTRAAASS